ncbi:MAG: hypothetical protein MO852_06795, partial [Candidatus Devosia euplotis]|nr:hypothetical protein [Candidatus Devosia euplotis]
MDLTINAPPPVISLTRLNEAILIANRQALALAHGGYVDLSDTDRQRDVIVGWISQTRTALRAEEVLLCNGAQQGLYMAFVVLQPRSNIILTETATFPGALAAANLGVAMLPVAIDEEGMLPAALEAALQSTGARTIYTTPVFQNPLGFEIGPARRRDLMAVALRHDAM